MKTIVIKKTIFTAMAAFFVAFGARADENAGGFVEKGVSVNGCDVEAGSGTGWTFADGVLTLSGAGPYVLSGTSTA